MRKVKYSRITHARTDKRICLHCGHTTDEVWYICQRCHRGSMKQPQPTVAELISGYVPTDEHGRSVSEVVRAVLREINVRVIEE